MTEWKAIAEQKRDSVLALIPPEWKLDKIPTAEEQRDITSGYIQGFLSDREVEITETDAAGIVAHTTTGKWSAEEVTRAFCHRAALAHQLLNCLHEIFFDAAIADAKKLDEYFATNKKPVGPLHGLPVSLKDQFHVKDVGTHMGYIGWIGTFEGKKGTGKERVFESEMVRELRNLGAVLYCKSSVPHTLMSGETTNNIIGYTWNPKNRNLASGGSSGGEGALIGARGSPVGFGTDIGGSIRIPAAFCGLFGLRPSAGRMPYEGMANSMDGQNSILSVVGPLATSVQSLRLVVQSLLTQEPWLYDPLVVEMPWRSEQEKAVVDMLKGGPFKKLSFGLLKHDGAVTPTPPVRRAMDLMVKAIQKMGHEVIEWNPPSHETVNGIAGQTWTFDTGKDVRAAFELSGEPMKVQVERIYGAQYNTQPEATATDIAAVNVAKRAMQKSYMDYWNSTATQTSTGAPVDAVISPLAPFPAARPELYRYYGYSMWVNAVDYTSVVVPVTTADANVDVVDAGYEPANEDDKIVFESYDPAIYDGAHVSLQLVGRRLQEEKMLAIAEYVADALKKA